MVPPPEEPQQSKAIAKPTCSYTETKRSAAVLIQAWRDPLHGPMDKDGFVKLSVSECNNNQLICIGLDCTTG